MYGDIRMEEKDLDFVAFLNTIGTLFLLIVAGFVAYKTSVIDDVSTKKLSTVIVKIGQPFLIISSLLTQEFSADKLKTGLFVMLLSVGLHVFMAAAAWLFSFRIRDIGMRGITEFALIFTNCGFVGFPILQSLYGDKGLFCGAFYLIGFHLFTWSWGLFVLTRGRDDVKLTVKNILVNFGTVPIAIGIVLFLLPFRMPPAVTEFTKYLGGLCTPVSLLITGALIATRRPREIFGKPIVYLVSFLKLILIPVVVAFILRLIGLDSFYVIFGTVMAAMPSAALVTMFSEMYSLDSAYASQLVGITTLLCTGSLPLVVLFVKRLCGV